MSENNNPSVSQLNQQHAMAFGSLLLEERLTSNILSSTTSCMVLLKLDFHTTKLNLLLKRLLLAANLGDKSSVDSLIQQILLDINTGTNTVISETKQILEIKLAEKAENEAMKKKETQMYPVSQEIVKPRRGRKPKAK